MKQAMPVLGSQGDHTKFYESPVRAAGYRV